MELIQVLEISDAAPVGLVAMAVAVLLGILAPALCQGWKGRSVLLGVCVVLAAAVEVLLRLLGTLSVLQIVACVLAPFTLGLLVGTLVQLLRLLAKPKT